MLFFTIRVKKDKRQDSSALVNLFLKEPKDLNYAKEYAVAKKLLLISDDFTFWKSLLLSDKRNKLNSLAYFLTKEGKAFLLKALSVHKNTKDLPASLFESHSFELEKNKIGKSLNLEKPNKVSLIDFIKSK